MILVKFEKKAPAISRKRFSLLVGPPGLEPDAKGLLAGLRNKTYLKLIGYA
jgi:hypothetical protein